MLVAAVKNVKKGWVDEAETILGESRGVRVLRDVPMRTRTSLGVGGPARLYLVPEEAEGLGEQVRRQIAAPGFASVPVTASFGVASRRDESGDLSQLIDQADQALYASKGNGRNRLTRFDSLLSR